MMGYNAYYGCPYCHIRGEYLPAHKHIYYPRPSRREANQLRLRYPRNLVYYSQQPTGKVFLFYITLESLKKKVIIENRWIF